MLVGDSESSKTGRHRRHTHPKESNFKSITVATVIGALVIGLSLWFITNPQTFEPSDLSDGVPPIAPADQRPQALPPLPIVPAPAPAESAPPDDTGDPSAGPENGSQGELNGSLPNQGTQTPDQDQKGSQSRTEAGNLPSCSTDKNSETTK